MCNPVSMIVKSDGSVFLPANDTWNHSHTAIAKLHGIPGGEIGDRYARVEVSPIGEVRWRDKETNAVLQNTDAWNVVLDEAREPAWWKEDKPALEDKCRQYAARYMKSVNQDFVPGLIRSGGDGSTLTGGDRSTLTGGDRSTLTGGHGSTLTGGDRSTLTGGDRSTLTGGHSSTLTGGHGSTLTGGHGSTLTGGDRSTLTGGDRSTLTGGHSSTLTGGHGSTLTGGHGSTLVWKRWDGTRYRLHLFYVGENGCKAKTKYRYNAGTLEEVKD